MWMRMVGWGLAIALASGQAGCAREHDRRRPARDAGEVAEDAAEVPEPEDEPDAAGSGEPDAADAGEPDAAGSGEPDAQASDAARDASAPRVISLRGRLMGPLRNPIPGWQIALGKEVVVTDSEGGFRFEGVSVPYDLSVRGAGRSATELWSFRGLTRADPWLQVDDARGSSAAQLAVEPINLPSITNDDAGLGGETQVEAAWGEPTGVRRSLTGAAAFDSNAVMSLAQVSAAAGWGATPVRVSLPVLPQSRAVFVGRQAPESRAARCRCSGCAVAPQHCRCSAQVSA